jgi:hypothetical protein
MCLNRRQLDPKTRRLMVVANISFILGILSLNAQRWNWVHGFSQMEVNWLDAFAGFFLGLYITIMLLGMRRVRRCSLTDYGK